MGRTTDLKTEFGERLRLAHDMALVFSEELQELSEELLNRSALGTKEHQQGLKMLQVSRSMRSMVGNGERVEPEPSIEELVSRISETNMRSE